MRNESKQVEQSENQDARITCKCGTDKVEKHEEKVESGYPGHIFRVNKALNG